MGAGSSKESAIVAKPEKAKASKTKAATKTATKPAKKAGKK